MDWRLLQLADSAFPVGAFAHSLGCEAMWQLGHLRAENLATRLRELVWHSATSALPFFHDAHAGQWRAADEACHAFLSNHVANRASRAQGRAFLVAASAMRGEDFAAPPHGHLAPAMGGALAQMDVSLDDGRRILLFGAARSALSAIVRLGVIGPLAAQGLLRDLHPILDEALGATADWHSDDACSVAPLVELAQASHDRLYSRLFQS
jgi:urease accessory protein